MTREDREERGGDKGLWWCVNKTGCVGGGCFHTVHQAGEIYEGLSHCKG